MAKNILVYTPTDRQMVFHNSNATNRLYGGAAGGGKTKAIRMEATRIALSGKGLVGGIFRRTYPELYQSVIKPLLEELPQGTYTFNESKKMMTFHKTGSVIYFGHIQYEKDVLIYQGAEFDFIGMDELTHFTEYMFKYLKSRLRTSKPGVRPCFFGTTNPGGIGHGRVKRLRVDADRTVDENKETRDYIPAKVYDNPYLMDNDPAYVSRLEAMAGDERKALLDGNWDVYAGQYFTIRRREVHVVEPFEIPKTRKRYRATDYGYTNPACVLRAAEDEDKNVRVYKELYGPGYSYNDLTDEIVALSPIEAEARALLYADPATKAKNPETRESLFDIATAKQIPIIAATNDRVPGRQLVREYLKRDTNGPVIDLASLDKKPKLRVFSTCQNLIRTMPMQVHDKNNVEDIDTKLEDHAPDTLRYLLMGIAGAPRSIKEVAALNQKAVNTKARVIKMQF